MSISIIHGSLRDYHKRSKQRQNLKKARYDSDNGPRPVPKILFFLSESLTDWLDLLTPRSRVQQVIKLLSFSMPTSARLLRVASPQDSAVIGFELGTARSQAEALTTVPKWLCEFSQFGLAKYQIATHAPNSPLQTHKVGAGFIVLFWLWMQKKIFRSKMLWCENSIRFVWWTLWGWFLSIKQRPHPSLPFIA